MKLDEYITKYASVHMKSNLEKIHDEFVKEGYEKFLCPNFYENLSANEYTSGLVKKIGKSTANPYVTRFLDQFSSIEENEVAFIFAENYSAKYVMMQENSKNAKRRYVIENIFPDDDTKNWIAIFESKDIRNISLMHHLVYGYTGTGDTPGGYKLYGKGLMYYAGFLEYEGNRLEPEWPKPFAHFQGNSYRRDEDPLLIYESRTVTRMLLQLGYYKNEFELFCDIWDTLLPALQKMYEKSCLISDSYKEDWKNELNIIQSQLVAEGKIASKWKSEQSLYTMIKQKYPDALFQYRPQWLQPQSLDIYIPELNLGIEYQGIQHYESIDFFGGEEAFEHRQKLDLKKKKLCQHNHVRLMEWPYTDTISMKNFQKKLKESMTDQSEEIE